MGLISRQLPGKPDGTGNALAKREPVISSRILDAADASVFDPATVIRLLRRRKRWVYVSVVVFVALAGVACFVMTPKYKAEADVEMLPQAAAGMAVGGDNGAAGVGNQQAEDALNFNLTLETQVSVLQSETLALQVIKELNLEGTKPFRFDPLIKSDEDRRQMALPLDQSPVKEEYFFKKWTKSLKVESVAGTRIIHVTFTHSDPQVAAQILNRLLADLIEYNFKVRFNATARMTGWLENQLSSLRTQIEESEKQMVAAEKGTGMFGPDDTHNIIISRLEQLNTQAADAETNRVAKEAIYNLARSGDPELVAGLLGSPVQSGGSAQNAPQVPTLLIGLRQQEAEASADLAEASGKYGPDNPKLLQLKNKVDSVRSEIRTESERVIGRARQEYTAAVSTENAAKKALDDQKQTAALMGEKTINFEIAKHQADSEQLVYQQLLQQTKEAGMLAGAQQTDLNILDPASIPGTPYLPNIPMFLAVGLVVGMLFGIASAFLRDAIDTTLRNPEDVEKMTELPVLGVIPRAEGLSKRAGNKTLPKGKKTASIVPFQQTHATGTAVKNALSAPNSLVMEAFRSARTSVLLSRPDNPRMVFMVTSPLPHEGKSFSSLHFAAVLAQTGKRVLLVDADLRRGTLSRNLDASSHFGLSHMLVETSPENTYLPIEQIPGMFFLAAGATPPDPAESLGSKKMAMLIERWRKEFDYVVIDSPPLLPVTDAAVLSQHVDGTIVVVRFAVSKQQAISRAIRILIDVRAECFGVLVNSMDLRSSDFSYYSGGYGTYGYYGEVKKEEPVPEFAGVSGEEK